LIKVKLLHATRLAMTLTLVGCSSQTSQPTLEVHGAPDDVARFVTAEKVRVDGIDVVHRNGEGKAVFVARNSDQQYEISRRAIAARLSVEAKSAF
jgi:uncharacterized lipoprotein YmbA